MSGNLSLAEYFADVVELDWMEYMTMETSPDVTSRQAVLFAIVRACVNGNLSAIQTSLDRLDGPVARNIEVIPPKFYTIYPYATTVKEAVPLIDEENSTTTLASSTKDIDDVVDGEIEVIEPEKVEELPTGKLRPVLERMMDAPQHTPESILRAVEACDNYDPTLGKPKVKSAMVAGLMKLAHEGKMAAINEVLEQIDGKVAEVFRLLGDDVIVTSYAIEAPYGATKNSNGVYMLENKQLADLWIPRLDAQSKRGGRG